MAEKAMTVTGEPERRNYGFRNGLYTWGIHQAWPDLPVNFRKYILLLEYFEHRFPEKTLEGDLLTLIYIIEEMLDSMAKKMEGAIYNHSGGVLATVVWTKPVTHPGAEYRFLSTPVPILMPMEEKKTSRKMLRMTPGGCLNMQERKAINYRFSLYLKKLEGLLAVGSGPGATRVGIVNPFGKSADMVGWALEEPSPGDLPLEGLREEVNGSSLEAQLHVPGCELKKVDKKYVEKGGRFRGIARLTMEFGDGPNARTYAGTGWLVDNKTIATAGHCVYHQNLGFLKSVEVVFGNETRNPTKLHGTHAVVHWCYYTVFAGKSDLGFIRLATSIRDSESLPLSYIQTPPVSPAGGKLVARGYPTVSEWPARMRSSECVANYDLAKTDWYLEYELDTDAGSSGCPIFDGNDKVVGIHVRTGTTRDGNSINKGVIIDERDNNPGAFCAVLDHLDPQRMRAVRGLFRGMGAGVMRYTPEKF